MESKIDVLDINCVKAYLNDIIGLFLILFNGYYKRIFPFFLCLSLTDEETKAFVENVQE